MGAKEIFAAAGFGTPFVFAAATYGFFYWLDRNASAQATRAISGWLKGQNLRRVDMAAIIISAFDRLYTSPLLTLRAFRRSASISIIVSLAFGGWLYLIDTERQIQYMHEAPSIAFGIELSVLFLMIAIISDYTSLFIVRRSLIFSGNHLIWGTLSAFLLGSLAVAFFLLILNIIAAEFYAVVFRLDLPSRFIQLLINAYFRMLWTDPHRLLGFISAFLVHLWLMLFVLGALAVRVLWPVFYAIEWAQWFLKQGNRHPLRAIGVVAAGVMFAGTAIGKAFAA